MNADPSTPPSEEASPAEGPPATQATDAPRLAFTGSGLHVFPLHLARLLVMGAFCLTLPFGLGEGVLLEVRALLAPLWLGPAWHRLEDAIHGLLSFLALPLAVVTLGLAWLPIRFLWLRWEQSNLGIPTAEGPPLTTTFTASLTDYVGKAFRRWLLTLLTLGLYRPWGWVASWRWTLAHTRVDAPD
jgi:hypothetical protein